MYRHSRFHKFVGQQYQFSYSVWLSTDIICKINQSLRKVWQLHLLSRWICHCTNGLNVWQKSLVTNKKYINPRVFVLWPFSRPWQKIRSILYIIHLSRSSILVAEHPYPYLTCKKNLRNFNARVTAEGNSCSRCVHKIYWKMYLKDKKSEYSNHNTDTEESAAESDKRCAINISNVVYNN